MALVLFLRADHLCFGDQHKSAFLHVVWRFNFYRAHDHRDFANLQIARSPLLGWGYQSFWLVGADAPSVMEAPGWVREMPNAHNGYVDTKLELGYIGFFLLIIFITATIHAIGRINVHFPRRAWLLLSLALFVIFYNFLESIWMRGYEFLWVLFLIVAADAARYWHYVPPHIPRIRLGLSTACRIPQRCVGTQSRGTYRQRSQVSMNP